MEVKGKFRAFRLRLLWENTLLGLLLGFTGGAAGVFCLALLDRILVRPTEGTWVWAVGGGLFGLIFLGVFCLGFPTRKRIAARMDEMGLKERVRTMLALENSSTPLAELQRQDAQKALAGISPGKMKLRIPRRAPMICAVALALAVGMLLVPYDVLAHRPDLGEENRAFLEALMEELREELLREELEEELREDLEDILDELEEDLKKSESELEQAAKLEEAKKKIEKKLEEALTKDPIGAALQNYELTRPLGEAIAEANEEKVKNAMDDLEKAILEDRSLGEKLASTVDMALSEVDVPTDDALRTALAGFALDLHENEPDNPEFEQQLEKDFDKALIAVIAALRQQLEAEEVKKKSSEKMEKAKKEALGMKEKKEEAPEETATEGGQSKPQETATEEGEAPKETEEEKKPSAEESKKPQSGTPGGTSGGEGGNGGGSSTPNEMTEEIYDPYSGSVPYGKVFALYYAEYLAALERGEVTDEMRAKLDLYYSALNG